MELFRWFSTSAILLVNTRFFFFHALVHSNFRAVADHSDELIIPKPSDLLRRVRALMDALVDLEHHVCIDVIGIFSTVFAQHTQPRDGFKV